MLDKAQSLVLRFFTIIRMFFFKQNCIRLMGPDPGELRIHYGPGYRVYFKKREEEIIILLCGGNKSTQSRDIETAKRFAKEWS